MRPREGHALTRKEGRAGPRAAEEPRKVNKYAVKGSKTGLKTIGKVELGDCYILLY